MKVVVTGAGGFVGREVIGQLLAQGVAVVGVDTQAGGIPDTVQAITGDLASADVRKAALSNGLDALVHLATLPGAAAEANPDASRKINIDAMYDLLVEAGQCRPGVRVVFASSIAVFGDPLPPKVDDGTLLSPKMIYGGHKAMMEDAVAMFSNRGHIDGVTVRLPGILARPKGPSGMKSAFISDMFHALNAGERFECPVSPEGTIWAQSVSCCAQNLLHALSVSAAVLLPTRAFTLPALRFAMGDLADEIARQCNVSASLVRYAPDAELEAAFASQPPLETPAAESAGFAHDGSLGQLVASALATLRKTQSIATES